MPPRPSPTHFLCIPLVTGASRHQLAASLGSFRADVSAPPEAGGFGVPETAVRPVGTIHLTLGVMSFPTGSGGGGSSSNGGNGAASPGLDAAVSLLKTLVPRQILASIQNSEARDAGSADASDAATVATVDASASAAGEEAQTAASAGTPRPPPLLSVTLRGLHSMQPASRATVLYAAPTDDNGRGTTLQVFCEKLQAAFREAGLMASEEGERDARPLLLHATVLNTIYVKGGRGGGSGKKGGRRRERLTVDARPILDRYDDFVWMRDVPLEKIAICRMGAKKVGDDGDEAYEVEAEIDLA